MNERIELVAPCGLDCGICELHICKDNPELFSQLISQGIPKDKLPCMGCRENEGKCPVMFETCDTYTCVSQRELNFCFDCNEFPCIKLHPSLDRADVLPHNLKIYNLCKIKNTNIQEFVKVSNEIKLRYFRGKMIIGKGPQI